MELFQNDQIYPEDLPNVSDIDFISLDAKHLNQIRIGTGIFSILLLLGLILLLTSNGYLFDVTVLLSSLLIWGIIVLGLFLITKKVFKNKGYALREKDIHYHSGWIFKKQISIPYSRIQHCDVSRGITDQMLDLSKLNVYTAGGGSSDITIPGLTEKLAEKLKGFVLKKTEEDESE